MMVCFLCILWAGHFYVWLLILMLQVLSFRELLNVRYQDYKKDTEKAMPLFRTLQWGWFYAAQFYVYADFVHEFALQNHTSGAPLGPDGPAASFFGLFSLIDVTWQLTADQVTRLRTRCTRRQIQSGPQAKVLKSTLRVVFLSGTCLRHLLTICTS